jgi:hypothetical protein
MTPHRLFGIRELGVRNPESNLDDVIREFLSIGDAVAARWIQMPNAVLVFQVVPGNPWSGAIYVYDRNNENFYMLTFEGAEDNLTVSDFNEIVADYKLTDLSFCVSVFDGSTELTAAA